MKGSAFNVDSNRTKTSTIYTYRKHERENDKPRYECVSDHALLTFASDKAILSNCKWIRSSNSEEICFIFLWYLHCVQQTNKASKHKHNAWVFSPRRRTCFYTLILARMWMHQIIMVAGPFALNPTLSQLYPRLLRHNSRRHSIRFKKARMAIERGIDMGTIRSLHLLHTGAIWHIQTFLGFLTTKRISVIMRYWTLVPRNDHERNVLQDQPKLAIRGSILKLKLW